MWRSLARLLRGGEPRSMIAVSGIRQNLSTRPHICKFAMQMRQSRSMDLFSAQRRAIARREEALF